MFENLPPSEDDASWDQDDHDTVELAVVDSTASLPFPSTYDPEQSIRLTQEREAAELREREALASQVGSLSLALESLLRLLKDKGVITDLDLRCMEQQVDLEDGQAGGEFHPGLSPVRQTPLPTPRPQLPS